MSCPNCGHENPAEQNFCGNCGTKLPREAEQPQPTGQNGGGESPPPEAPKELAGGRYKIDRYLGEGGRKRVYLAHDTVLDRDVAIGIVKTGGLDPEARARVIREAQSMARLGDHPHVVTVHDIGEDDGDPYIVSQFMAGGALDTLLARSPSRRCELETTLRIADGITQALEYAHARGVIHRDLKPANVFLTEDGVAKLGDFGLAFSMDRRRITQAGLIVGTASYMAPEQALGQHPDAMSDLYSLGAVMYEMVTGRPPFVGDDIVSVISQHQRAEPVRPSWHADDVPHELEELIMQLLEKRPDQRPSAPEIRERLRRIEALPPDQVQRAQDDLNRMESLAEGVFVGREQEVGRLRAALEDAIDGRGRLTMLVGEPGIGKTRTAQELGTYARVRGARVLVGRSYEGEGAPAYWPWLQMARAYIHEADPDQVVSDMGAGVSDIAQVMSDLQDMIPGLRGSGSQTLEPEQERFRFFDSITTFLKNVAQREPLVLFLDDLHWADAPSLRLLQFLARELSDSRMLVVGTYRDVALGRRHPLSQALADLSREGLVERVPLHGLTETEVERFIEVTASIHPPRSLVRAVYGETEGNPFFVSEIVSLMASEGTLDDAGQLDQFTVTIPQGVREVVGRRLDRLSEDCNRVLAVASAIGREFGVEVVERVAELPRDRVLELLEEAEEQRIVSDTSQPGTLQFMFSHALVREALYEELGVTQRVRLHRRIAEAIEEICVDDREAHLGELAHHFLEAQELERAIEYSSEAAKRAVSLMAYEEGADLYESALQALELKVPTPDRRHGELLVKLAHAQTRAAEGHLAKENFRRAALLARELGDHELFAEAAEGLSGWAEIGVIDYDAIALIEEALESLGEEDSVVRARLLARLSVALYFVDAERREELAREAVAMARRVGDPATLAFALNDAHFVLHGPGSDNDRVELASELIEVADKAGDHELAIEGRGMRLMDLLEAGRIEEVDRELPIYDREATELRQPNYKRYALIRLAMKELLGGRFENVERLLAKFSPETARHGLEPNTLQAFGVVSFALRRDQGRLDGMEDSFKQFVDQYPAVPGWRAGLAVMYMELDRRDDARREFELLAEDDFALIPEDANWVVSTVLLSEVAHYLGDVPRAQWLYDHLLPYAERNIITGGGWTCHGNTERFLGLLAHTLGRYEAADRHFRAARRANASIGAHPLVAYGRFEHARLLVDRNASGDRQRANDLLGQALESAYDIGMPALVDRALALRVRIQGIDSADVDSSIDAVASVVEEERPDLRGHTAPDGTVTILFSDIERSTELNERLGDQAFFELLREHNEIVRDQVRVHRGFEVKSQGDGFMIAFASPTDGVECSIAIQRALATRMDAGGSEPIMVRMGLHTGEAIRERDDFFGRNVVLAARIAAQAGGGEILVSAPLKELAEGAGDLTFGDPRELGLKGLSGTHTVHPVEWEAAAAAAAG
jgi:class 3 adenylate cyclase/tetratricopeptide (TPR) repeat protein